jgi:hypothetical protein
LKRKFAVSFFLSFPCLRAVALQRAGVKTGIQDQENEIWIPASAGMTSFFDRIILRFFKELKCYQILDFRF